MSQTDYLFKEAIRLLKNGDVEQAIIKFNEIEDSGFESDILSEEDFYIARGSAYLSGRDIKKSMDDFESALSLNPSSVEACMGLAKNFVVSGLKKEAKVMFEWAVKNGPENKAAIENLKKINELLGYELTHNSLDNNEVIIEEENNFNPLFEKAYRLFFEKEYDRSLENLEELQMRFEEDLNILKGNIYLAKEEFENAKLFFEKALKVNNKSVAAYNGLAGIYKLRGMLNDAKIMYERALSFNPEDTVAGLGLTEINRELDIPLFHTAVQFITDPKLSTELNEKLEEAYKLFQNKEYEKSLSIVENVSKEKSVQDLKGVSASVDNFAGFNLLALDRYNEAQTMFENALKKNPHSSQACAGLAELWYIEGKYKESKTMYEWALKNKASNHFAKAGLAKTNEELGFSHDHSTLDLGIPEEIDKEFTELITKAYELFSAKNYSGTIELINDAEQLLLKYENENDLSKPLTSLYNFRGFNYLALQSVNEAEKSYQKALEYNPKSSQACAGLGEVLFLNGKDEEAKKMYEYGVIYGSRNQFAISGLKKVNKLLGLPENDNSLLPRDRKATTDKISNLIESAYEDYNKKSYNDAIDKLSEAEKLVEENFDSSENFETLTRINNFLGFNYMGVGDLSNAKECFTKALNIDSNSSQACAGLGEVLYLEGQDKESKTMYEWAVKNNPNNNYAVAGLAKLNRMMGKPENDNSLMENNLN
ncbi:MAG: tetratricopeptide repeat protein [Ignavibacteria bacterium]|jgi:Tfp pilus assembly protein PilF